MALAAPILASERQGATLLGVPIYWHLLSLDAPTIAILWAWSFARAANVHASLIAIGVLGIGTWLVYVTDRLLDGRFAPHRALHARHFFHARHWRAFLAAAVLAALVLLYCIGNMPAPARIEDTLLFALSVLYFAVVHLPFGRIHVSFPREPAVGILFAAACAVPAWSRPDSPRSALAMPVILFAALCTLNCLAIEIWERRLAQVRNLGIRAFALTIAAGSVALMFALRNHGEFRLAASAFVSAILILALDRFYRRSELRTADPEKASQFLLALRVAVDVALLTPLLFVLPWHL